jgi:hypothetical protein
VETQSACARGKREGERLVCNEGRESHEWAMAEGRLHFAACDAATAGAPTIVVPSSF